jgi:tRNA U34 5-methylaminomethyl-2-thiouridine-forming methyltransferase MnmC
MMPQAGYTLSRLANGAYAVHSLAYAEKMHPGLGPANEAEALYVGQLKIRERLARHTAEFVVWDVGLGAAANSIAVLGAARDFSSPLRLVSFDNTPEPLAFALNHTAELGYFSGYDEPAKAFLERRQIQFTDGKHEVNWKFCAGDFPTLMAQELERVSLRREREFGTPHAILFDAFSPAKNPAMWTLPLFTNLFRLLDPARSCALTTYSRSTMIRITLLLAGFFVGRGVPAGLKEETTVASNALELIEQPLGRRWLERARRSDSAEPLLEPRDRRAPLSLASWEKLRTHAQFV